MDEYLVVAQWVWFAAWAVALTRVDLLEHRLPNAMVAIAFAGGVAFTAARSVVVADPALVVSAALGSLAAVAIFAVAHFVGGLGMGDVKYAAVTGWVLGTLGWQALWWGHFAGFVAAGFVVVLGWLTRRMHRSTAIAFGPFMGAGTLAVGALSTAGMFA